MIFRIDPTAGVPLYEQLAAQVRVGISRGELTTGERLPAARDLADSLDVNVHTVLKAYQLLRDDGLVELRRGRGAVVAATATGDTAALHAAVRALADEAARLGTSPQTVISLLEEQLR
ncbi:GntR family transcriptional regulator [Sediminihabitans luteus]|uniref:GntR family transcriptional regulator n=1 Tax=Sediminihabitans luteus TaxID=1138585 RepID=A0A2M9CY41_9CELL|nr:GntR family transcriptional regulator [Sediminihabitans luteus]PJJ76820.1 GntR family transcriptional regulator [Sediminihabitans luteus]GIJ00299.1 hypothetical protein Slu03_26760 [Sediminihabitans luteus]